MPLGTIGLPVIPAYSFYYGRDGEIQAIIVHSLECDIKRVARSLAGPNWFGGPKANSSVNILGDPYISIESVAPDDTAWAVGNGNPITYSQEFAGRASFSRAQWSTPDAIEMYKKNAAPAAIIAKRFGIPLRWLSVVQLARGEKGFATHNDCSIAFGGSNHWDPGPNFRYDLYMQYVRAYAAGQDPAAPEKKDLAGFGGGFGDDMKAYLFVNSDGKVMIGNLLAFQWVRSEAELTDRLAVLRAAGVAVMGWTGNAFGQLHTLTEVFALPKVSDPYAFGEDLSHPDRELT